MPIINADRFPVIDTSQHTPLFYKSENLNWDIKDWNKFDYWYCEIKFGDAFKKIPLKQVMPDDTLKKIKEDTKTFFVVCNSHEAFHHIVEPLYQTLVINYEIPPKKIILMSESADIHNEVKRVAEIYDRETIQVEWSLIFERQIKLEAQSRSRDFIRDSNLSFEKKFLNLNRRWRLHRIALVALLTSFNLLDKGFVSLAPSDDRQSWSKVFPQLKNFYRSDPYLYELLCSNEDTILNLPDLYLDTTDLVTNRAELSETLDIFYKKSFFSIVTETNFYFSQGWETGRFFSEKIFKPIAHKHPFILLAEPFSLELLKDLGYKTYDPWIDESYDRETDDFERLKKILYEIDRLCSLSDSEIKNFVKEQGMFTVINFYRSSL